VLTGSYDEMARVWDLRNLSRPTAVAEVPCGGGVWRLKWHPTHPGMLAAACMYGGFLLLRGAGECQSFPQSGDWRFCPRMWIPALAHAACPLARGTRRERFGTVFTVHAGVPVPSLKLPPAAGRAPAGDALDGLMVVEEYTGHDNTTIAYGVDWCRGDELTMPLLASCSFYEQRLNLWSPSH
jgi:hypothetical protein